MPTFMGLVMLPKSKIKKRAYAPVRLDDDIAPFTPIAAIRPRITHMPIPIKTLASFSAVTPLHIYSCFIDKYHGLHIIKPLEQVGSFFR
jgi:hypothetical protein